MASFVFLFFVVFLKYRMGPKETTNEADLPDVLLTSHQIGRNWFLLCLEGYVVINCFICCYLTLNYAVGFG